MTPVRVAAVRSFYSNPAREGEIAYHNGVEATNVILPYRIPDDWLFLDCIAEYTQVCSPRRAERTAVGPFDARPVLYGAVSEFIVSQCLEARDLRSSDPVAAIHARWLLTPREDLRKLSPRDVLLAKREFIDFDLQSRELQWSLLREPAPCLHRDSAAYRFAGFGTHEVVVYYDLVRLLLAECWKRVRGKRQISVAKEIQYLEKIKDSWLTQPQLDFGGRTQAYILECERKRLPLLVSAKDFDADEDCPLCQSLGHPDTPGFWHMDCSNMDDDFPFSFCRTYEEWEEERCEMEQCSMEWEQPEKQLSGREPGTGKEIH
jgi:hypothetical protein